MNVFFMKNKYLSHKKQCYIGCEIVCKIVCKMTSPSAGFLKTKMKDKNDFEQRGV